MSGRRATRSLLGGIRSGQGTFGSSMRIAPSEAGLGGGEESGGLGGGRCGDGIH